MSQPSTPNFCMIVDHLGNLCDKHAMAVERERPCARGHGEFTSYPIEISIIP